MLLDRGSLWRREVLGLGNGLFRLFRSQRVGGGGQVLGAWLGNWGEERRMIGEGCGGCSTMGWDRGFGYYEFIELLSFLLTFDSTTGDVMCTQERSNGRNGPVVMLILGCGNRITKLAAPAICPCPAL